MSEFSADQYFEGGNFTPAVADEMEAIMRRLRSWAAIARSNRGVLPLAADEADAILAALERAERVEAALTKLADEIADSYPHTAWSIRCALAAAPEGSDG